MCFAKLFSFGLIMFKPLDNQSLGHERDFIEFFLVTSESCFKKLFPSANFSMSGV